MTAPVVTHVPADDEAMRAVLTGRVPVAHGHVNAVRAAGREVSHALPNLGGVPHRTRSGSAKRVQRARRVNLQIKDLEGRASAVGLLRGGGGASA